MRAFNSRDVSEIRVLGHLPYQIKQTVTKSVRCSFVSVASAKILRRTSAAHSAMSGNATAKKMVADIDDILG